ncbi:uncharacterized protein [Atheta coriaria]|uniref:uncharacterized protein n=1 Tax=Dalotia coriaria TaxID=877792 RepID=UPI0031F3D025
METVAQSRRSARKIYKPRRTRKEKTKFKRSIFEKRKRKYDIDYHYIEDVEYPSKIQRFFMVVSNPFWYNLILGITLVDAMLYTHSALVGTQRLITSNYKYQLMFEIIVTVFKIADISLAIVVDYIMKLEFHNEARRPIWVLGCEIFGALPLYPPVPLVLIKLGHFIKFVRLMYHNYIMRVSLRCHFRQRVLNFVLSLIICETIYAWTLFHISGYEPSWETYMQLFEVSSASMVGKGVIVSRAHHYTDNIWLHEVPLACGIILVLFIFLKPTLCDIICLLTMQYENKFKYIYKVQFFQSVIISKYNCNHVVVQSILTYLRNYWEERQGCMNTPDKQEAVAWIFPRALIMEMALDTSYDFFRHSQILRDLEIPLMRNLSLRIKNQIFMKGEYVFNKRKIIDYMIYIKSGVIDILSSENGESGIISFSAGTILGETALFYPSKSQVNIRCQCVCHIFKLTRRDFTFLIRHYPYAYHDMLKIINSRLNIAKRVQRTKLEQTDSRVSEEQIVWLKAQLHNYKAANPALKEFHLMKNIYLGPFLTGLLKKQNSLCHTLRCLELLSIKRRLDIATDLVFIRSKCIWILKHNSPIYHAWHFIIAFLAFIMLLLQPYVVFNEGNIILNVIIAVVNLVFFVDLLLTFITPASKKSKSVTLHEIFGERFNTIGVYLDICSIFHFPLFGHVFPFANEKWVFIFHTVKLWKIYRVLNKWEDRFHLNLLLQKYCVFILSQFVYVYTMGYILTLDDIISTPLDPVGIQISTGVGFKVKSGLMKVTILYALLNTFAAVFEGLGIVSVTTANYMKYVRPSRIYRSLERLYHLSKRNPDTQLFKRLNSFLNTQINDNNAFTCAFDINKFFNFPQHYNELMKTDIYANALLNLELFQLVPKEVIKRVSSTAHTHIFHQHSLVMSYGTRYDMIYILIRGEARSVYGEKFYKTKEGVPMNVIEVLFQMPSCSNVVAVTEVEIVSFCYSTFLTYLASYKGQVTAMKKAIAANKADVVACINPIQNGKQMVIETLQRDSNLDSFVSFSTKHVYEDSFEEFDYYSPFDQSRWGIILKYFLMKSTILPNGRFLFWWEVVRCIFAYITCIVFFIPPISLREITHPFTYFLIFLDCTAFADIYLRLHVCYYSTNGLIVTHPLHTAMNYIKKAFMVDFLASFPFYLVLYTSPQYKIIANVLHVLQIYRLIGFKLHYFCTSYMFDYGFILLTIICPVNFITCVIFVMDCYDWENEENVNIFCKNFKKDSPLGNYITVCYFIMSTLTCSGTGSVVDLENVTPLILHIISACSFVSIFVRIYVTAYLFGSYNKIYLGSHKFRDKVRRLVTFLRMSLVRPYLRKQIKIYYELKWRWLQRINPFHVLKNLNPALRRDLIYCLYGIHIHECTSLNDISNRLATFFKNALYESEAMIIPKNGYILSVNDIESNIYFLIKGSVDVVAANGTVIETINDGSILGNLEPVPYTRIKVSFVTNTVAKLLYMDAKKFYNTLDQFPVIKKSFCDIKNVKFYYIPSKYVPNEFQQAQTAWTVKELKSGYKKYNIYFILSWFHFVFPCCIGLMMELYQIATGEMHVAYLITQYIFDLIHLSHQYLKFTTPYMNQEQEFVMHPLRIKAHSMGKKRIYYKLYFLNLPFDVPLLLYVIMRGYDFAEWSIPFSILRLNRLSRYVNITHIYYNGTKKVASFSRKFKIFMLFLLLIYSSQIIATIIAFSDYSYTYYMGMNESQIIREMPVEILINSRRAPWMHRVELFGRYWFFSLMVHTFSHDNLYYPKGDIFEIMFIIIFLYVTVFESFVMVQYYQILMESTTLIKILYSIRKYVDVYYSISKSAYVLRESVEEAINHYYSVKSVADDYIMMIDCPKYLREAALMSIYGYLFHKHPYFSGCHPDVQRQIIQYIRCVVYPINGTVVSRLDCHDTLYFVHTGEVAAMQYENDCTSHALYVFCKGDSFGYQAAFMNLPYQYTFRTITFCEIVELQWSKCKYLLDFFPMSRDFVRKVTDTHITHYIKTYERDIRTRKRRM